MAREAYSKGMWIDSFLNREESRAQTTLVIHSVSHGCASCESVCVCLSRCCQFPFSELQYYASHKCSVYKHQCFYLCTRVSILSPQNRKEAKLLELCIIQAMLTTSVLHVSIMPLNEGYPLLIKASCTSHCSPGSSPTYENEKVTKCLMRKCLTLRKLFSTVARLKAAVSAFW